jgi:hypothetical protein
MCSDGGGQSNHAHESTKRAGFEIVAEFYDAAVSGADPIQDWAGFAEDREKALSSVGPPIRCGAR